MFYHQRAKAKAIKPLDAKKVVKSVIKSHLPHLVASAAGGAKDDKTSSTTGTWPHHPRRKTVLAALSAAVVMVVIVVLALRSFCHPRKYCTVEYHWPTPGVKVPMHALLLPTATTGAADELARNVSNVGTVDGIPMVIYQTYHTKHRIPAKVRANMKKYAPKFLRLVFDDTECHAFLKKHFHRAVADMFYQLEGPHRSDVFRYAVLFVYGGVYIDIKTELLLPLSTLLSKKRLGIADGGASNSSNSGGGGGGGGGSSSTSLLSTKPLTISVLSGGSVARTIFQGVIASPKGNPLFLRLIQDFLEVSKPIRDYFITTRTMYEEISKETGTRNLTAGLNQTPSPPLSQPSPSASKKPQTPSSSPPPSPPPPQQTSFDYYLFEERARPVVECYDGADRHRGCYFVFRGADKVMKIRYADFPW